MKKALYIFTAIATLFLFNSCAKDPEIPNLMTENPNKDEGGSSQLEKDEEMELYKHLEKFSSTSYPKLSNTWTITDTTEEIDAFHGLRDALYAARKEGRKISLVFPNLTSVPTVTYYEDGAFFDCDALISVDMPLVTTVGNVAFRECSYLAEINLPLLTTVDYATFYSCSSLTSIYLPSVTSVYSYAFRNCSSLSSISLPYTTKVGGYAFHSCNSHLIRTCDRGWGEVVQYKYVLNLCIRRVDNIKSNPNRRFSK